MEHEEVLRDLVAWEGEESFCRRIITFEMHVFGYGRSGMSVNNRLTLGKDAIDPSVVKWVPRCVTWLDQLFSKTA